MAASAASRRLQVLLLVVLASAIQQGAMGQPRAEPTRRALLVGIDKYQSSGIPRLSGCANDVQLMKSILVGKFDVPNENVRVLVDEQAKRSTILEAIRKYLIEPTQPGDVVIFHYSGHGSQMQDVSGDEIDDGLDETLVPYDSRTPGVFDISDDEINGLLRQITQKTPHVAMILDSCHSGTAARNLGKARRVPKDERTPPKPADFATGERGLGSQDDFGDRAAGYVLISGCRARQLSNEGRFDGEPHGALTFFLASALSRAQANTTYRDIMEEVTEKVTERYASQEPQIAGADLDSVVFGTRSLLPQTFVRVEPDGSDSATLVGGAVLGLVEGTELAVYPPGTKLFDGSVPSTATVRVGAVGTGPDLPARRVSGTIAAQSRAPVGAVRQPGFQLGVFLPTQVPARTKKLDEVAQLLVERNFDDVEIVTDPSRATVQVVDDGENLVLQGTTLESLGSVPIDNEDAVARVVEKIGHWARWYALLSRGNPDSALRVAVDIRPRGMTEPGPSLETVAEHTPVEIVLSNRTTQPLTDLHYVLVLLQSDGSAVPFTSSQQTGELLPAGRSISFVLTTNEPDVDVVKLIASSSELDPNQFHIGTAPRTLTALEPEKAKGWATAQRTLRTVPTELSLRADTIVLHFNDESSATSARDAIATLGLRDAQFVALEGDARMVALSTTKSRSGEGAQQSVGRAFEEAYAVGEEQGAARAEPLFTQYSDDPDAPDTRSSGSGGHDEPDPRACSDDRWSLKLAQVPGAWAKVRAATGRAEGHEADGVMVAHPDTGYRKHPEIWSSDAAQTRVRPDLGWDYVDEKADPLDPLVEGVIRQPAHGTGSGSAIVSPAGCQADLSSRCPEGHGDLKCPTGTGAGARLVPLRVGTSVAIFDTRRVTQAILDALAPASNHRMSGETQMLSIAMGGTPSYALWRAVKRAEDAGYLILAAAGNNVRTVVWPARFQSTIAVAAVGPGCRPWSGTSMGPAVDISAPGQWVWRATVEPSSEELQNGMSTGTTYATGTTAGVAALWIARHRGTTEFENLRQTGRVVSTFRSLLAKTAWRPDAPPEGVSCDTTAWDPEELGPGILNAERLIDEPLVAVSRRAESVESLDDLPLFSSLYPPTESLARVHQDYRRLFLDAESIAIARYEGEVVHHYATSSEVRGVIDAVVAGDRSDAAFERVRGALLARDLSRQLRAALE